MRPPVAVESVELPRLGRPDVSRSSDGGYYIWLPGEMESGAIFNTVVYMSTSISIHIDATFSHASMTLDEHTDSST